MRINLKEIGRDDNVPEGIFSIATRDLSAQYFMVKRQPDNAWFASGQLVVYKVEIVKSYHEQQMYKRAKWNIWHSEDMSQTLAFKMFGFASNRGISIWKRFKDSNYPLGDAETIAETPATIKITKEELTDGHSYPTPVRQRRRQVTPRTPNAQGQAERMDATSVKLWQAYANVLWQFITRHQQGSIRIDGLGRTIVTQLSQEIPGGAIRPLEEGILNARNR